VAPVKLEGADYEQLVQEPLDRVAEIAGLSARRAKLSDWLRRNLEGVPMPLGLSHGDLTADNISLDRGRIAGIIDWEESRSRGLPLVDVIAYAESVCRVRTTGLGVAESFSSIGGDLRLLTAVEIAAIECAFASFGASLDRRRVLAVLAWIYHCDALLRTQVVFDPAAIERRVAPLFAVESSSDARTGVSLSG
jgi:Phosphotransferase enzyme family